MNYVKKITMQDIADACGLSRNTVSKVFNGRGTVPKATCDLVMAKALEFGYIHPSVFLEQDKETRPAAPSRSIALLTHSKPRNHYFGSLFISNFTDQICRAGFNLKVFEISKEEYDAKTLPSYFVQDDISGIVVIELFDREYTQMLCGLGIPVIHIDSYACAPGDLMRCDLVFMENYASSIALTKRMIDAGAKCIGFVGDMNHCSSFRERWNGFKRALEDAEIPLNKDICIIEDDSEPYGDVDWVVSKISAMPFVPDGFVCANDFHAIRVMKALKTLGYSIPARVMVTGFDGKPEAEVVSPTLTTADIPAAEISRTAADMLLERIASPSTPYKCVFIKTTPIWRESVR